MGNTDSKYEKLEKAYAQAQLQINELSRENRR
jgi:hypothetical protein